MFKFHELDRSVCLTCQHFKGKRKVEVIGRKMFIDFEKNTGNCRIFNDFPVIISTHAGHCSWCHYKRWNQLPAVEKPEPTPPPKASKPARLGTESRKSYHSNPYQSSTGNSARQEDKSSAFESQETSVSEYTAIRGKRGGCLGRIIKLAILVGLIWWLNQKFHLVSQLNLLLDKLK